MSLLHDGAFMAHLEQSKVEAKQQVNSLIDAIYAKLLLDLELWLNKHESKKRNDSSVQQFGVNHNVNENVISPLLLPPSHLQTHSNHFTVKNEIESDCEENKNLPGESPDLQPAPPEPLQPTHSITSHSSSLSIVKDEIADDVDYNFDNEVEVNSRVIQNEQSANDPAYLQVHNEFCHDTILNNGISEFDEISNRLLQNTLTHQPREYNQEQMHFDDNLEIDQDTLDEVKREIKEEEEMKRRENEHERGDERPDGEGGQMDIEQSRATIICYINNQTSIGSSDNGHHNFDGSLAIQHNQNDTNNAIEDQIANESTTNPTQPNLVQSNRLFQCPHCSKTFNRKSNLQEHIRVHTGERPFACGQCGKRFSQMSGLAKHKLIHLNIKGFPCDQCDKKFVLKCQLDKHLRTHSGDRPFQCNFCEMSFSESGSRRRHEQAKHLHVKSYRCKECGHTATQRSTIITHIRIVHFGLPRTLKQQREHNIIDDRDSLDWLEKIVISTDRSTKCQFNRQLNH